MSISTKPNVSFSTKQPPSPYATPFCVPFFNPSSERYYPTPYFGKLGVKSCRLGIHVAPTNGRTLVIISFPLCNQPSECNILAPHSFLEASSSSYEPVDTQQADTVAARVASRASMDTVELTCAKEPQDIPEPATHVLSTAHPAYLHSPLLITLAVYRQN